MIVSWMTTNKCNLTCKHCYQDAGENKAAELTTAEALKLIDEIAKAGFKIMIFSGGEPMTRPDIVDLVAHASSKGLRPVFGTNGTLITHDLAFKLKAAGASLASYYGRVYWISDGDKYYVNFDEGDYKAVFEKGWYSEEPIYARACLAF